MNITDLPAVPTKTRAKPPDSYFLHGGIERLTYALRAGDEVSRETQIQAIELIRRCDALRDALNARYSAIVAPYPEKPE